MKLKLAKLKLKEIFIGILTWRDEKRQIANRKLKWEKNKQFNRARKRGRTKSSKKTK